MIIDSHCHAWRYWPYLPAVPDPESRGTIEQLLFEMDQNGVDRAVVVCARIDHNPDNNDYVAYCRSRFPDRLIQFADVDCSWTETYHQPGAAQRLAEAIDRYQLKGFTHYVRNEDDGSWFLSDEGLAFFQVAAERRQIASLSIAAQLQPVVRQLAERFPTIPFLCHHLGVVPANEPPPKPLLHEVLASARLPNVYLKFSGFAYASSVAWEYPYPDCAPLVRTLYEHFGPDRLLWGSDYPPVRRAMTYQHALEAVRTHCRFIPAADLPKVLGDSLQRLLDQAGE
jgi:predicted TIM-barrel fold metal-dependent hydrolase